MIEPREIRLGAGLVALAAIGAVAAVVPSWRMVRHAESAIAVARSELGSLGERPAQLERQAAALAAAAAFAREHTKPIPMQGDVAGLVRGVSQYLDELGVRTREIATGAPVRAGGLICMPLSLTMRADFESVFAVLERVASMPRLIRARRLRLAWEGLDASGKPPAALAESAALSSPTLKAEILLEIILAADETPDQKSQGGKP